MNSSEKEKAVEGAFHCGTCDRWKDDIFILPDGSVVCADCVDRWESEKTKQN
jgi:hypothetical protein